MHPIVIELSLSNRVFALDANGLCLALGAVLGVLLALRGEELLPREEMRELALELLLVGVIGARLVFVATDHIQFMNACLSAIDAQRGALAACARPLWLWEGGLSFYGGLFIAIAWLAWRMRARRELGLSLADRFAPALALAEAFAWLGCLLAGSCYGRVTTGWGLRFPVESIAFQELTERGIVSAALDATPPLVPVQLYAATAAALLCALLLWARTRVTHAGLLFAAYLAGNAILELALTPLRADLHATSSVSGQDILAVVTLLVAALIARFALRRR